MAKFCVPYVWNSDCRNSADIIEIQVNKDNAYSIKEFIDNNSNKEQSFLINFDGGTDVETCKIICGAIAADNVYVRFNNVWSEAGEWGCNFVAAASSWEDYYYYCNLPYITDIIVLEELMFDLDRVKAIANRRDKRLWCHCNRLFGRTKPDNKYYLHAFVRPEEVAAYSEYIDVFILSSVVPNDITSLDTLYDIYTKEKKWDGTLATLVVGRDAANFNIDGCRLMAKDWAKHRMNCKRRCMKGQSCTICDSQISIAQRFKNMGFYFSREEIEHE